jgi:hypothetical protein
MQIFNCPTFNHQFQLIAGKSYIFDFIRKKYVRLTPEEWTRQHLIHHLTQELSYPRVLIRIEKQIEGYQLLDRPDLVAYDRQGRPLLVAECKAVHVPLSEDVYFQLVRYNRQLQAPLLVITNGKEYGCWNVREGRHEMLDNIPAFETSGRI